MDGSILGTSEARKVGDNRRNFREKFSALASLSSEVKRC